MASGNKVVPPPLPKGAKRIFVKKMEEGDMVPAPEEVQKAEGSVSSESTPVQEDKVNAEQEPTPSQTPAKLYSDGDMFVHVLKLVSDKMVQSRENDFAEIVFSFIEAEMLRKLLQAGAERTERFNQYYAQVINREGAISKVLNETLPPVLEKLGLLNSLKESISRGLKQ